MTPDGIGNLLRQIFMACTAPAMLATVETDRRIGEMFIDLVKVWTEIEEDICGRE